MPATRASNNKARSSSGSDRATVSAVVIQDDNNEAGASPPTDSVADPSGADDPISRKKRRALNWEKDNRPPRPANAFISFKSSLKDGPLKREYAARLASGENIGVIAQQMWKCLSEDERDKWYVAAKQAKVEHSKKYPDYKYQPQKRKEKKKASRRRKAQSVDPDEEYEEEEEAELSDTASGVGQEETTSVFTPTSDLSEDIEKLQGEPRMVEVYMGASEDLDRLYKNGWKWALIRDYDGPPTETTTEANNPIVHLPTTTESETTANPLAVELISMASVLNNLEPVNSTEQAMSFGTNDALAFQQMFNPWDYPPPQNAFFYDGQPALEVTESMLKLGAVETSST